MIEIPGYGTFDIEHIVCDYNGTIAREGVLLPEAAQLLNDLAKKYTVHIITADTFGNVQREINSLDVKLKILTSRDHTAEKKEYIDSLGYEKCAALGNGNNDIQMLELAAIAVAVMGDEGCSAGALMSADIVCKSCVDALTLFKVPKRVTATLRK